VDIDIFAPEITRTVEWALARVHMDASRREDARQCILLELWKAIPRFDPSRGVLFRSFAAYRAIGAVRDFFREGNSRRHAVPVFCALEDVAMDLHSLAAGPEALAVAAATVDRLMFCLNPSQRYAVTQHWLLDRSVADVAADMGISEQRVSAICRGAQVKMRIAAGRRRMRKAA
jgi:RNA polymerase sigma factor (sigma-70 family)